MTPCVSEVCSSSASNEADTAVILLCPSLSSALSLDRSPRANHKRVRVGMSQCCTCQSLPGKAPVFCLHMPRMQTLSFAELLSLIRFQRPLPLHLRWYELGQRLQSRCARGNRCRGNNRMITALPVSRSFVAIIM